MGDQSAGFGRAADSWFVAIAHLDPLFRHGSVTTTTVKSGSILGDRLPTCLCWQKLKEWGIIG
jgi:hypothetical protein